MRALLRHQLAAYSPLSARSIAGAFRDALLSAGSARHSLQVRLRQRYAADEVVLVDRGTSALRLAIEVAASGRRDAVVALPAYTCFEVATAAVGAGLGIVLYDLDPASLRPDVASLERALDAGASIVVATPLFGIPIPWEQLTSLVEARGATLVEDAAQGHAARWRDRPLGSLGTLSVLSFGRGKGWTGSGGGALLARPARGLGSTDRAPTGVLHTGAQTMVQYLLGRPALFGIPASIPALGIGRTIYHPPRDVAPMSDLSAGLLLAGERDADAEGNHRWNAARRWHELLGSAKELEQIAVDPEGSMGALRYPILLPEGVGRLASRPAARRLGIAAAYPAPLGTLDPVRDRLAGGDRQFPGAERLSRDLITLPTHSRVAQDDVSAILRLLTGA